MAEQEITAKEKQQVEGQEKTRAGRFFLPGVDIYEFDDSIKLWVDMPGVKESDVEVTTRKGFLLSLVPCRPRLMRSCRRYTLSTMSETTFGSSN